MTTATSTINLRKETVNQVVNEKNITGLRAQVVVVLDHSGSMDWLYENGFVQRVLERLVPMAMQFDDNGEMELYIFQNNCVRHKNNVNDRNVDGIVEREIRGKYNWGGTSYAPAINMIIEDFIPKGMFGGNKKLKDPVYVIFITDGDNSDKTQSEAAIREASKHGVFFQFVGIGKASMAFLDKLDTLEGRAIDNANFFQVNDLETLSDKELYERLLNEFPGWVPQAKSQGILG